MGDSEKNAIDAAVAVAIGEYAAWEFEQLKPDFLRVEQQGESSPARFAQMTSGTVRLVIDEVGGAPDLVRAVISAPERIREELRKPECLHLHSSVPIEIMIGGTGSTSPDEPLGLDPAKCVVWDMDDCMSATVDGPGGAVTPLQRGFVGKLPPPVQRALLGGDEQDDGCPRMQATDRLEFLALLKNARLGALIAQWANVGPTAPHRNRVLFERSWRAKSATTQAGAAVANGSDPELFTHLAAADAIIAFRNLNAMCRLDDAEFLDTLAIAMTLTVLNCLSIGADAPEELDDGHRAMSQAVWLRHNLVASFGVLQDRARRLSTAAPELVSGAFRAIGQPDGNDEVLVVPNDGRGRYEMPDAYRAMYLRQLFGVPPRHGPLEELVWQQAAALAPCVTPEHSLWDVLLTVNAGYIKAGDVADDGSRSTFTDRSSRLRHSAPPVKDTDLAIYEAPASPYTGAVPWQVHLVRATEEYPCKGDTACGDLVKVLNGTKTSRKATAAVQAACRPDAPFRWPLAGVSAGTQGRFPAEHTAVVLNRPLAPCCDVIVADARGGRKELIGIAAKACLDGGSEFTDTMHREELAKWGDIDAANSADDVTLRERANLVRHFQRAAGFEKSRHLTFIVADESQVTGQESTSYGESIAVIHVSARSGTQLAGARPALYPLFVDLEAVLGGR